jgi:hypothetical protein
VFGLGVIHFPFAFLAGFAFRTRRAFSATNRIRRDGSKPISRVHRAALKFLYSVYKETPELGSHFYAAIRISLRSGF